ncbi:MAG: hypothetical protein AMXMBFR84_50520 [Candidatus Hydrogenedentota bacterium]
MCGLEVCDASMGPPFALKAFPFSTEKKIKRSFLGTRENYPDRIYGEPTERIGDWVYVYD